MGFQMIVSIVSVLVAAILVVVDQLIKHWATVVLQPLGAITVLPGILELRYYLNDGMAFSMCAAAFAAAENGNVGTHFLDADSGWWYR